MQGAPQRPRREVGRARSTPLSMTWCLICTGPLAAERRRCGRQPRAALRWLNQARAPRGSPPIRSPSPVSQGGERCAQPAPAGRGVHDATDPSGAARRCTRPVTPPPAMDTCEATAAGLCGCALFTAGTSRSTRCCGYYSSTTSRGGAPAVPSKQRCSLAAAQKKHIPTWTPLVVAQGNFKQGHGNGCRSAKHVATPGLYGRAGRAGTSLLGGDGRRCELAGTALVVIDDVASAGTTFLADDERRREPRGRGADGRGSRGARDARARRCSAAMNDAACPRARGWWSWTTSRARAERCSPPLNALLIARGHAGAGILTDVRETKARSTATARGPGRPWREAGPRMVHAGSQDCMSDKHAGARRSTSSRGAASALRTTMPR